MQKNCLNWRTEIAENIFGDSSVLADVLKEVGGEHGMPRVVLVADMNVVQRTKGLGSLIGKYFLAHGITLAATPVLLAGGEKIKYDGFESVQAVANAVLSAKLGANDCVLAIGGGTLLDVAGYVAAQVRGGVKIVRVPTTPAAMIDAAFAETAALDGPGAKDGLRVPCRAAAVVIDLAFASTVLDGVWRGGSGAAIRLAAVSDAALLKKVEKTAEAFRTRDPAALAQIVEACLAVRQKKGGTTFAEWCARRIEAASDFKIPHGYAVALGVSVDTAYAAAKGLIKEKDAAFIRGLLDTCGTMDGLAHARNLFAATESMLSGLDDWTRVEQTPSLVMPAGLGKATVEEKPDRAAFTRVFGELVATSEPPAASAAKEAPQKAPEKASQKAPQKASQKA